VEAGAGNAHLVQPIRNNAFNFGQPEGGDDEAVTDAIQELRRVVDQIAANRSASRTWVVEVFDPEIAVNREDPI
jgi:hypothetical protein